MALTYVSLITDITKLVSILTSLEDGDGNLSGVAAAKAVLEVLAKKKQQPDASNQSAFKATHFIANEFLSRSFA